MIDGRVKVVFLGGTNTGKTAVLSRYFDRPYRPGATVGIEVGSKMMKEATMLRFYDMGGASHWWRWIPETVKEADFVFVFYDTTCRATLSEANEILGYVCPGTFRVILVGNKTDLEDEREVTIFDANRFIQSWQSKGLMLTHIETSVHNITALKTMLRKIVIKLKKLKTYRPFVETSFQHLDSPSTQKWSQYVFNWD